GEAVRVEGPQRVRLLPGAADLDRDSGDGADGEGASTAGVAVKLREDEAGEADGAVELLRGVHRLLARHGVGDEQDLRGLKRLPEVRQLLQVFRVQLDVADRVHEYRGRAAALRFLQRRLADVRGAGLPAGGVHGDAELLAQGDQLFHGGHALGVGRHHEGVLPLGAQVEGRTAGG